MDERAPRAATVVNLELYRRQRQVTLPLFDPPRASELTPLRPRPRMARLGSAEVSHRQRMLRFLMGR